eukprot:SM000516S17505  [mRNA]  locus=s516:4077:4415:- [translate_table: standard]
MRRPADTLGGGWHGTTALRRKPDRPRPQPATGVTAGSPWLRPLWDSCRLAPRRWIRRGDGSATGPDFRCAYALVLHCVMGKALQPNSIKTTDP